MMQLDIEILSKNFQVEALPDTGCTRSIIREDILLREDVVINTDDITSIKAANQSVVKCVGSVMVRVHYLGRITRINAAVVVGVREDMMISYNDLRRMGIIHDDFPRPLRVCEGWTNAIVEEKLNFNDFCEEFKDVFDESKITPMKGYPQTNT